MAEVTRQSPSYRPRSLAVFVHADSQKEWFHYDLVYFHFPSLRKLPLSDRIVGPAELKEKNAMNKLVIIALKLGWRMSRVVRELGLFESTASIRSPDQGVANLSALSDFKSVKYAAKLLIFSDELRDEQGGISYRNQIGTIPSSPSRPFFGTGFFW